VTQDESEVSVGGLLALDQVLKDTLSYLTILVLRKLAKDRAQREASKTYFGHILGFLGSCKEKGMSARGFTHV
jgi:hypothetical protein